MSTLAVTPIYAAVLTVFFLVLSALVIGRRRSALKAFGDGGDRVLAGRIRAHGNFAEYVPFALLLMLLAEVQGAPSLLLHGAGVALIAGRVLHALAMTGTGGIAFRTIGMVLTFTVVSVLAAAALF